MRDLLTAQTMTVSRIFIRAGLSLVLMLSYAVGHAQRNVDFADPFIGTDYTGHTFPAASCPLGMVQPGPDTGNYLWKYCSGYNHADSLILGFSQNRLNGTGVPSLCNVLLMPFSGACRADYSSRKQNEKAGAGYYSVSLPDNGVDVDITCSERVSCYTFDFHASDSSEPARKLFVNFQNVQKRDRTSSPSMRGFVLDWEGKQVDEYTFAGHLKADSWVEYDLWYRIVFDTPVVAVEAVCIDPQYKAPAMIVDFGKGPARVKAKISLSYTSAEGAVKNLAEVDHWDFARVRENARESWCRIMDLIDIDAPDSMKTAFYTSLYHMYLQPNIISDFGDKPRYSTFSQWDTFRAADPLRMMLTPDVEADIVNCMIDAAAERGHLPVWDLAGRENYCMIANHAVPTVVAACLQGLEGVDPERAYAAVKASLTQNHQKSDWDIYNRYGYYPYDLVKVESVSRTLETCYDDYCAALLAAKLGRSEDCEFFTKRSQYYKNLFDPSTGFFRGKDSHGNWNPDFEPYRYSHASHQGGDYTEGNAWHYLWHVLHEPSQLMQMLGGKDAFVRRLDTLFDVSAPSSLTGEASDVTGLIGQYSHGNEPCHHVIYLYTLAGRQDKAEQRLDEVFARFYLNEPGGLCGNDDCGQMSAWYIYSALGYYPLNPVSGEFVSGKKQVRGAVVRNNKGGYVVSGTVRNKVTGQSIADVVVSDGYSCVKTDAQGFYCFTSDPMARTVSVSVPAGYELPVNNDGTLGFYALLESGQTDFVLEPRKKAADKFTLVAVSDAHLRAEHDFARFTAESWPDIQNTIKSADVPIVGIALGDQLEDKMEYTSRVKALFTSFKTPGGGAFPFFYCIGNHDHDNKAGTSEHAVTEHFERNFCPRDYSFNIGKVHVVVMDDIQYTGVQRGGVKIAYSTGLSERQIEWLRADLAMVRDKADKTVVFCVHAPMFGRFAGREQVCAMLGEFAGAHVLSGHEHNINNVAHHGVYEHNIQSLSGAWWHSNLSPNGSPLGYAVLHFDGSALDYKVNKATTEAADFQMRVYSGNDSYGPQTPCPGFEGEVKRSNVYEWPADLAGCFVVRIWDGTSDWDVRFVQKGKSVHMQQTSVKFFDAASAAFMVDMHGAPFGGSGTYKAKVDSFWTLPAPCGDPSKEKGWKIVATRKTKSGKTLKYTSKTLMRDFKGFATGTHYDR